MPQAEAGNLGCPCEVLGKPSGALNGNGKLGRIYEVLFKPREALVGSILDNVRRGRLQKVPHCNSKS